MVMSYYQAQLNEGLEFQDFCSIQFAKIGIPITNFSSKKYQLEKGENMQGYEFKFDKKFRKTGNFWIETEERSNINKEYIKSGINRNDNTIFYVIGDYSGVYLMQKKVLIFIQGHYKIIENNVKTSRGYLLSVTKADIYFNYFNFKQ